jgi:Tfp pilus assembly protein PilV
MKRKCSGGFSLVEVAIALAVASFCLITISGLLSVGLSSSQTSSQESIMANIAGQVADDLRAAPLAPGSVSPFYGIVIPGPPGASTMGLPVGPNNTAAPIYVLANGGVTTTEGQTVTATNADYSVWVGINPPTGTGVGATVVRILITWPPQAAPNLDSTGWPTTYSGSYETMLTLNRN